MVEMKKIYSNNPKGIRNYNTEELREEFLIEEVFIPDKVKLTYTYNDRMIFGGIMPLNKELEITLSEELGVEYFLERRELGVINLGGEGIIILNEKEETILPRDGFYIGKENKKVIFKSKDIDNPAKFYIASAPAHKKFPNKKLEFSKIKKFEAGDKEHINKRTINQYIHSSVVESCQLQMGLTTLEKGCAWNTMPCHTHERRMEAYFYFDLKDEDVVFHFLGKPNETKHLVIRNEQATISPSWSIHSGVGTSNYSFIWAMCGENITYTDLDVIDMKKLK